MLFSHRPSMLQTTQNHVLICKSCRGLSRGWGGSCTESCFNLQELQGGSCTPHIQKNQNLGAKLGRDERRRNGKREEKNWKGKKEKGKKKFRGEMRKWKKRKGVEIHENRVCGCTPPSLKKWENYETEKIRERKISHNYKKMNQNDHQFSSWSIQNVQNSAPLKVYWKNFYTSLKPLLLQLLMLDRLFI